MPFSSYGIVLPAETTHILGHDDVPVLVPLGLPYVNILCLQIDISDTYRWRFLRTEPAAVKKTAIYRKHDRRQIPFAAGFSYV